MILVSFESFFYPSWHSQNVALEIYLNWKLQDEGLSSNLTIYIKLSRMVWLFIILSSDGKMEKKGESIETSWLISFSHLAEKQQWELVSKKFQKGIQTPNVLWQKHFYRWVPSITYQDVDIRTHVHYTHTHTHTHIHISKCGECCHVCE